jgi:hypothetical protein
MTEKNDPCRACRIRNSTSPALVNSSHGRYPLPPAARSGVRSYGAAPIRSVTSRSDQVQQRHPDRLPDQVHAITGTQHLEQLNRADWDKATGGLRQRVTSSFPTEDPAAYFTPPRRTSNPTTPRDAPHPTVFAG